ncbi:MAG: DRTGG domain-containing protein [Oscillospiraceae bacterium]|jgi:predicted transcriptional regulator|nr:DRTGG domain-containing protein [Oscillospiraceae bacterium]
MTIADVRDILNAFVITGQELLDKEVHNACGSDMMSDVLAFVKDQSVLLTGLVNAQVVRTAEMMDMVCIVFVRGKEPGEDIKKLAQERGIVLMKTPLRMFPACGLLYNAGLRG